MTAALAHASPVARLADYVARASEMVPWLAERSPETERLRRLPDDVQHAVKAAGFIGLCRPDRAGGAGFDKSAIHDVCSVLARGCASTAWVVGNLTSHEAFMAQFPDEAQDEVWAEPDMGIGSSFIFPAGRATPVPGGYHVSGRWPYSSGIHLCRWCVMGAVVAEEGARRAYFLLPDSDYEVLDTWDTVGLRGTGSTHVEAQDAFVPAHRVLDFDAMIAGRAPGLARNPEPHWRFPLPVGGGYVLVATLYGAARGACDALAAELKAKVVRLSGRSQAGIEATQVKLGHARAIIDTVDLIARTNWAAINHGLETAGRVPPDEAIRIRRDSAFCARLCCQAVDILLDAGGGTALFETNPVQRAWRDIHAGAAHVGLGFDTVMAAAGRAMLGQPTGLPGLP